MWTYRIQDAPYKVIDTGIWPADFNSLTEPVWLDNERIFIHTTANYNFGSPPYQSVIYNTKTKEITATPLSDVGISCIRDGNIMYGKKKPNGEVVAYRGNIDNAIEHPAPLPEMKIDDSYDCDWVPTKTFGMPINVGNISKLKGENYHQKIEVSKTDTQYKWKRTEVNSGQLYTFVYHKDANDKGIEIPYAWPSYSEYLDAYVIGGHYYNPADLIAKKISDGKFFWILPRNGTLKEIPFPKNMLVGNIDIYPVKPGYLFHYNSGEFTMNDPGARGLHLISNDNTQPLIIGDVQNVRVSSNGCQVTFIHASNTSEYLSTTKPYRTIKLINFC